MSAVVRSLAVADGVFSLCGCKYVWVTVPLIVIQSTSNYS